MKVKPWGILLRVLRLTRDGLVYRAGLGRLQYLHLPRVESRKLRRLRCSRKD